MSKDNFSMDHWSIEHNTALADYTLIRPIRSSHRWVAYLAKDSKGKRCTLTILDKAKIFERFQARAFQNGTPPEEIEKEADRHYRGFQEKVKQTTDRVKGLVHENVAETFGMLYDRENDQLVIASEYTPGIDLFYATNRTVPTQSLFLYAQALNGLSFIHHNGLLHLNVKPQRIFVDIEADSPLLKFIDFGFAVPIGGYDGEYSGTLFYMAPEVILNQRDRIDERADLFSFGITLYYCLTGQQPLGERVVAQADKHRLIKHVERESNVTIPPSHYNKEVPPPLDKLVLGLLQKNPDERSFHSADDALGFIHEQWPQESRELTHTATTTLASADD